MILLANEELYHYGVLGMKWGVRRARKNVSKAKTARESAKEWDEFARDASSKGKTKAAAKYKSYAAKDRADAKKYDSKAKQIEQKHRQRAGSKTYDRVKNTSTGKLFAQSMLMGTYGTLKYHQAKAEKKTSTGRAVVEGLLYGGVNGLTSGGLGVLEPRLSERSRR